MKKFLFLAIAAAAMTSCSQDEVLEVAQKQAIAFGTSFVENSTRAATDPSYVMNSKDITKVDVWGTVTAAPEDSDPVLIFNSADIEKTSYGSAWTQKTGQTQYWVPGATYKFIGIVDGEKNKVTSVNIPTGELLPASVNYTADGATDLLCDVVEVKGEDVDADYAEIVNFNYTHLLSKVKFTLTDNSPADANGVKTHFRYSISDIKITNAYAQGVYNLESGWTDLSKTEATDQTDDYCTFGDIAWDDTDKECAAEKLLLPFSDPSISFTLTLQGKDANGGWATISEETINKSATITLAAAKAYNFNISVGVGKPIEFTVENLTGWVDADPQPGDITF